MEVRYRKLFLKDLKKLKSLKIYDKICKLVFEELPNIKNIEEIKGLKQLKGSNCRYRIRIGNYRIGLEIREDKIELMRILHRRDFYRYFP